MSLSMNDLLLFRHSQTVWINIKKRSVMVMVVHGDFGHEDHVSMVILFSTGNQS